MYQDALDIPLTITTGGNSVKIPGGNVKQLQLEMHPYGLSGRASFVVSSELEKDPLFTDFMGQELMEISLKLSPHFVPAGEQSKPMQVSGLVTGKSLLLERVIEDMSLSALPILYRYYRVEFADPAQVLWRQHYPYDLLVDKTMKDLIEAHKNARVNLSYDWDILDTQHSIIALPLGFDAGPASFYDFVMWYVDAQNGVWNYDSQADSYKLTKTKDTGGQATTLRQPDVAEWWIEFPETRRSSGNLLNGYSEDPEKKALSNAQAVDGVYRDFLGRYPVSADFQNRETLEQERIKIRQHELNISFQNTPLTVLPPGDLLKLEGGLWSPKIFPYGKEYRVRDLLIKAEASNVELTADQDLSFTTYDLQLELRAETQDESWTSLPPYRAPVYPFEVEGKILSEQGSDDEETYQIYQDTNTSLNQYKVKVPLWSNFQVVVPFKPDFFAGHFYFPAYRDARVLVALELHKASIQRFLDWRAGAQLPMDSQGNKLLMGKTATSQTYLSHTYADSKPVLNVQRTSGADLEVITLKEGSLILETTQDEDETS